MSWIGMLVVGLILLMLVWQWRILRAARSREGQDVPAAAGAVGDGKALYYFHSESCGACRGMTPMVADLAQRFPNVHSVDVQASPELASQFQVRATPTTVLVDKGRIERVLLGAQSRPKLDEWLSA